MINLDPSPHLLTDPAQERKVLKEVKNIPSQGLKKPDKMKKKASSILKPNGSENHPLPSKRPKVLNKPYSSISISSSDEDSVQSWQRGISLFFRNTDVTISDFGQ